MPRLALLACVLLGCSSNGGGDQMVTCTLFEGVSKRSPPGGVTVNIGVPADSQRDDYADGSCTFEAPDRTRISVRLELCLIAPCPQLPGGSERVTTDRAVFEQTMRSNTLRLQDPTTHLIVACSSVVQAERFTPVHDARLNRGAAMCDTLTFTPR